MSIIKLFYIELFAIITGVCGFASLIIMILTRWKYTVKTKEHVEEIGDFGVAAENTKLTKLHTIATRVAIVFFAISLVGIFVYSSIFAKARKYGAYGDFYKTCTLAEIKENNAHGFIDQSDEVPEDTKGCMLIFFKWGCPDCNNIHDQLVEKMKDYEQYKLYFVSTRSDRGKQLVDQYAIDWTPSMTYVYYEDGRYQTRILNDGTELNEHNLDVMFSVQRYVRCFETPDEYEQDRITELPDVYKQEEAPVDDIYPDDESVEDTTSTDEEETEE